MSYTVFARKYRPQTFSDLVGQEHVTRTLGNAIRNERVAHSFLFTGVRGVGKTTSARILAKALNCEKGPSPEPCNTCAACTEITQGTNIDVLEIDGASNRGVDDVRRLQESIPYQPARDRHKLVIIDEVHMVTREGFNALLKTLEEPPPHVKFIFATTEAHKVPITIRSRCQRYDFRLITRDRIAERVREILTTEQIESDALAIDIVAREANGSMRDALTLLDQVVAFSGDGLNGNEVARNLGLADRAHLLGMARHLLDGDAGASLQAVDALCTQGVDLLHFSQQLLGMIRDMVVLKVTTDRPELVDLTEEERAEVREIVQGHDPAHLQRSFAGVASVVEEVGRASAPRTILEMGLVRLASRPPLRALAELVQRMERLEASGPDARQQRGGRPAQGRGSERTSQPDRRPARDHEPEPRQWAGRQRERGGQSTGGPSSGSGGPRSGPDEPHGPASPAAATAPSRQESTKANPAAMPWEAEFPSRASQRAPHEAPVSASTPDKPSPEAPPSSTHHTQAEETAAQPGSSTPEPPWARMDAQRPVDGPPGSPPTPPSKASSRQVTGSNSEAPRPSGSAEQGASRTPVNGRPAPGKPGNDKPGSPFEAPHPADETRSPLAAPPSADAGAASRTPLRNGTPAAPRRAAAPDGQTTPTAPPALLANWDRVVAAIRDDAPTWSAIFEHAVPLELGADRVRLSFASSARFAGQQASDREGSERLQKAVEKILGGRPDVQVEYSDQNASSSLVARSRAARDEHSESLRDEAMNHPRVKEARQLFPEVTSRYDVQVEDKRDRPEQGD